MRMILGLGAAAALAAACATAPEPAPAASPETPEAEAVYDERNDPFIVMISAERYSILIERALKGALGVSRPYDEDATDVERAHRATLDAAHDLYLLRDAVCERGLLAPEECAPLPPPPWFGEVVAAAAVDLDEVNRRIEWLEEVMWPFMNAGCAAGDADTPPDEPGFCSIE